MSVRGMRHSKFRHVFGTANKAEFCYNNIKITKSPFESNMCAVNAKFVAVVLEAQGGGAFLVINQENVSRGECGEGVLLTRARWCTLREAVQVRARVHYLCMHIRACPPPLPRWVAWT